MNDTKTINAKWIGTSDKYCGLVSDETIGTVRKSHTSLSLKMAFSAFELGDHIFSWKVIDLEGFPEIEEISCFSTDFIIL